MTSTAYVNGVQTKLEDIKNHELKQEKIRKMAGQFAADDEKLKGKGENAGLVAV